MLWKNQEDWWVNYKKNLILPLNQYSLNICVCIKDTYLKIGLESLSDAIKDAINEISNENRRYL